MREITIRIMVEEELAATVEEVWTTVDADQTAMEGALETLLTLTGRLLHDHAQFYNNAFSRGFTREPLPDEEASLQLRQEVIEALRNVQSLDPDQGEPVATQEYVNELAKAIASLQNQCAVKGKRLRFYEDEGPFFKGANLAQWVSLASARGEALQHIVNLSANLGDVPNEYTAGHRRGASNAADIARRALADENETNDQL